MIPPTLPQITSSNWRRLHDLGWRYCKNLPRDAKQRNRIIKQFQDEYGVSRVTLGHPWSTDHHGPVANDTDQALYINDVENQVAEMEVAIAHYEKTGEFRA